MKNFAALYLSVMIIFFSGLLSCSIPSTVNNPNGYRPSEIGDLQLAMDGLWIEMMSGNPVSNKAYIVFLGAAELYSNSDETNFQHIDNSILNKLLEHDLAYTNSEDSRIIIDPSKLELWDKNGSVGYNLKPYVKGLR